MGAATSRRSPARSTASRAGISSG
ncbi:unnamed protein product [Linum tenue]|uniref:Uncharacterized protein n=1 Tax=Linum tenue TaxID=586396 RepID=A0AAV0QR79_9ROSI|nr:unnamed protein product [Linum tenue]